MVVSLNYFSTSVYKISGELMLCISFLLVSSFDSYLYVRCTSVGDERATVEINLIINPVIWLLNLIE